MTSQISREILVAMWVVYIFQDGGKSPERLWEQPRSPREKSHFEKISCVVIDPL